jgi:hypothetical protein
MAMNSDWKALSRPAAQSAEAPAPTARSTWDRGPGWKPFVWQRKLGPAFWTITGVLSLVLNVVLIVLLVLLGRELFGLKSLVSDQLLGGLYGNFVLMDQAVISASVPVEDEIPVRFLLPVETNTTVILTEDTYLTGARVDLSTGGLRISNAPTDIVLKKGTELPVALNIDVPVDTTVPVRLTVDVRIPLRDTELHAPFVGLQNVVAPYNQLLSTAPDSWEEALCATEASPLCAMTKRATGSLTPK